jgi:hypothetical protein
MKQLNPLSEFECDCILFGKENYNCLNEMNKLTKKNFLIGACKSGLYFSNEVDRIIEKTDWSFKFLKKISCKSDQIIGMRLHKSKYY